MTVAGRGTKVVRVARRGYGELVKVEVASASRRRAPRGRSGAAGAPRGGAAIVGSARIGYPRGPMNSSLLPALLASPRPAVLALADGTVMRGYAAGDDAVAAGEFVFNTSMFGYQEMLTDPSYKGQILVLTTPHVGVVGANDDDPESGRVWAEGLVVPDLSVAPSNWRASSGLLARLAAQGVPVAWGFDTRALVLRLREKGALPGVLVCGREPSASELAGLVAGARGTDGCDLTRDVARPAPEAWSGAPWHSPSSSPSNGVVDRPPTTGHRPRIVVLDCGATRSILRRLVGAGADVTVVPPDADAASVLALAPAGVVVSNGPGDPAAVAGVPATIAGLLGRVPLLGVCLGHQLLAVALGARTYKLPFGHHGGNHPVKDLATGGVWITSQNHNYAVDAATLPPGVRVSMTNLTDGSVEGIVAEERGAEGIQFHPEAGPGPHDALGVFGRFVDRCRRQQ